MAVTEQVDNSTTYAWLRTRFSVERTLMAWGRTGTALIGFGFTIGEVLSRFNAAAAEEGAFVEPARFPQLPAVLGLSLIAVGTLGLAFACFEYTAIVRYLRAQAGAVATIPGLPRYAPTLTACLAIVVVGAITFLAIVLRRF